MSRSKRGLFCLILGLCLTASPAWGKLPLHAGPPPELREKNRFLGLASLGQGYNIQQEKTLTGVIEAVNIADSTFGVASYLVEITIRGKSQKLCLAELAPYWYIHGQHFNLPKGEKIKVRGFLKPEGDNYRMLATAIISNERTLKLRNKLGMPLWSITPQTNSRFLDKGAAGVVSQPVRESGSIAPEVETQRPKDYGPPQWAPQELPWWLAWIAQLLGMGISLLGGPESTLLIMLGLLGFVMIRTYSSKRSWHSLKLKHDKS